MSYNISVQLTRRIKESGLSVRDIARRIGITPTNIYSHKSGRVNAGEQCITQYAAAFGISVDEFMGFTPVFPKVQIEQKKKHLMKNDGEFGTCSKAFLRRMFGDYLDNGIPALSHESNVATINDLLPLRRDEAGRFVQS